VGTYAARERSAGEYPDLARVVALARRWWWALLSLAAVAPVLVALAAARSGATYEAQARVLVGPVGGDLLVLRGAGQQADTLAQLATSRQVLAGVRRRLGPRAPAVDLSRAVTATADDVSRVVTITVDVPSRTAAAPTANAVAAEVRRLTPRPLGRQVRLVDPAVTPAEPVGSATEALAAIAVFAAFLGGLAVILLADYFRGRIMTEDELVELGAFPHLATLAVPRKADVRAALADSGGAREALAAPYGALVGRLDLSLPPSGKRTLLVTGVQPDDGGGDVAAGIAAALVAGGDRVVLVDADTEGGDLTRRLGLRGHPGLSELLLAPLRGRRAPRLADVVVDAGPGLRVVPSGAGSVPRLPEARRAVRVLQRLARGADAVVLSAGPAGASAAALAWAGLADGTLLVVQRRRSRRDGVRRAVDALHHVGARTVGTLLVERRRRALGHAAARTRRAPRSSPPPAPAAGDAAGAAS
jgi:Mrp family chromosome partitioning ATPase